VLVGGDLQLAPKAEPAPEERELAKKLIEASSTELDFSQYRDVYKERLTALIETKVAGKEIVAAPPQEERHVINLMEALRQSIAQSEKASSESPEETKPPKKMAASKRGQEREGKRKSNGTFQTTVTTLLPYRSLPIVIECGVQELLHREQLPKPVFDALPRDPRTVCQDHHCVAAVHIHFETSVDARESSAVTDDSLSVDCFIKEAVGILVPPGGQFNLASEHGPRKLLGQQLMTAQRCVKSEQILRS
jgi:hypothetical protein